MLQLFQHGNLSHPTFPCHLLLSMSPIPFSTGAWQRVPASFLDLLNCFASLPVNCAIHRERWFAGTGNAYPHREMRS